MNIRVGLMVAATLATLMSSAALADETGARMREVTEKLSPSLVTVSFGVENAAGARAEVRVLGCVVGEDNLVMITNQAIPDAIPAENFHDFRIVVRSDTALKSYKATYLGKDNTAQVALLRTDDAEAPKLPPVTFSADALAIGDPVLSFASLGEPDAYKVIVRLTRVATVLDKPFTLYMIDGNLGVLGTPVATLDGKLVGIVGLHQLDRGEAAGQQPQQRMATVQVVWPTTRFADRIKNLPSGGQRVKQPWLGVVKLEPLKQDLAEHFGLGERRGVIIGRVIEGEPAAKAGLQAADMILSVDGQNITGADGQLVSTFTDMIRQMKIGQEVTIEYLRNAEKKTVKVTLTEEPKSPAEAKRLRDRQFGLTVREITLLDTVVLELPRDEKGAIVEQVEPSSWADAAGLKQGDIIKTVASREVADFDAFKTIFEEEIAKKPKQLVIFVQRGKQKETALLNIEPRWDGDPAKTEGEQK